MVPLASSLELPQLVNVRASYNISICTQFNHIIFYAAIFCEELPEIENGEISYAPDSEGPEYDLGTVATYTCDGGFMLVGSAQRICQNGNFTGIEPFCSLIRELLYSLAESASLATPPPSGVSGSTPTGKWNDCVQQ